MFTRVEAIEFALEKGLKGANFIHRGGGQLVFYYWEDNTTNLRHGSRPGDEPVVGKLAEALQGQDDGWFVSAKTNGEWFWYFDSVAGVPHKETSYTTIH